MENSFKSKIKSKNHVLNKKKQNKQKIQINYFLDIFDYFSSFFFKLWIPLIHTSYFLFRWNLTVIDCDCNTALKINKKLNKIEKGKILKRILS